MKSVVLKSPINGRFRFGTAGLDDTSINRTSDFFHADTLFSAMVNVHAKHFDKTDDFVNDFQTEKIKISSGCFCFEKDDKFIFFLHKPLFLNLCFENDESYKKFRDIRFISKGIWEKGLSSEEILKAVLIGNQFACLKSELESLGISPSILGKFKPFNQQILAKVTVNRSEASDRLFFQASIELAEFCRLKTHYYFLQDGKEIGQPFYELLSESGIGGELNVGCGSFESVKILDFNLVNHSQSDTYASQSIVFPNNLEELKNASFYETIIRGGRRIGISGGESLKQIRGILEGAVFENKNSVGQCVNLVSNPELSKKKFLRYGHGFLLPISENWKKIIPPKISQNDAN